jgi:heavy metal sensor kinase
MNLPIRVRLTLWNVGLLAVIIAALGTFLVLQLSTDLHQEIDDETVTTARSIQRAVTDESADRDNGRPVDVDEVADDFMDAAAASLPSSSGAQLIDEQGRVLAYYGAVAGAEPLASPGAQTAAREGTAAMSTIRLGDEGQHYRVQVSAVRDGDVTRVVVVALSMQRVEDEVRRVLVLLLVAGPVTLGAAAFAAYWLARKALRPVERMASDAEEIGSGQLHERLAVPPTRDEIGQLAVTLNAMLDRIERGVTDKQRLVADASHELRTPLAVMRAELDVSLRGDELSPAARDVLESAREEVDHMSRTVDNLLTLAQVDEGRLELLTVPVSLGRAIDDAARPLRSLAAANGVSLVVDGGHWEAQADPQRLHLALTNLIENAIKFTQPGGTVRVTSWQHGGEVGVSVSDEGPGISAEEREHLFDRYYRSDSARTRKLGGSGLGLAICHEVALAHGGRLWVDSEPGHGSTFRLALPGWRALPSDARGARPDETSHLAGTT